MLHVLPRLCFGLCLHVCALLWRRHSLLPIRMVIGIYLSLSVSVSHAATTTTSATTSATVSVCCMWCLCCRGWCHCHCHHPQRSSLPLSDVPSDLSEAEGAHIVLVVSR